MSFPLGLRLRLGDLEEYDNTTILHELQRYEPITWFEEQGVWLVTSKRLFDELQSAPERFTVDVPTNPQAIVLGHQMLVVDGEEHARHRSPFATPFRHSEVRRRFTTVVEGAVDRLLRQIEPAGHADLASAFANPFAVSLASDILGLGFEHIDEVHDIYTDFATGMVGYRDPVALGRAAKARARLDEFLRPRLRELRARPDGSLLAEALSADGPSAHSDETVLANLRLILFGSIETVESMILNTTWLLLQHPDQLAILLADPGLWPAAVQEGLRLIPPVGYTDRWAVTDTELGGVRVSEGDYVLGVIHAVNRDPTVFPHPDRYELTRANNRQNASFGKGTHMCLGVNLARLQGTIALRAIFERLSLLRLDPDHLTQPTGFNFRRPPHLHVRWETQA